MSRLLKLKVGRFGSGSGAVEDDFPEDVPLLEI
jgi:hypothetical protein